MEDTIYESVAQNLGVPNLDTGLITCGVIFLILSILNFIAICAGNRKCGSLKRLLGSFYTLIGIATIVLAVVEKKTLNKILDYNSHHGTSKKNCNSLAPMADGFYAALNIRAKLSHNMAGYCQTKSSSWAQNLQSIPEAVESYNLAVYGVENNNQWDYEKKTNSGFALSNIEYSLKCSFFCLKWT